ncbi:peptide ABC transporter permease [Lysinibacillus sp. PLM2]|nr:peptide ABC transporter permease [Lysinibacillus sp. PLM2]
MEAVVKSASDLSKKRTALKKEQRRLAFSKFIHNKQAVTGFIILALIVALALLGPIFISSDPYEIHPEDRLQGPSGNYIFGTDNLGRDLLARVIFGAQISLLIGLAVAFFAGLFGTIIGLYASYYKILDNVLMRICEGIMAIPAILLAIALMAALGPSTENIIIALSIVYTPYVARVVRSSALVVREETYIEAMKAIGAKSFRIIWGHIAPNVVSPLIIQITSVFANAILIEATLSFLGAGVPAPTPSWGNILYDGKMVIFNTPWMVVFPGICIVLAILALNMFGDGLRDILDPHSNNKK